MAFVIGIMLGFYLGVGFMCVMSISAEQSDDFLNKN